MEAKTFTPQGGTGGTILVIKVREPWIASYLAMTETLGTFKILN